MDPDTNYMGDNPAMPEAAAERREPHGAAMLRRFHKDHNILMGDYHDGMQILEPDSAVRKHFTKHMTRMEDALGETEGLFGKHYKDYDPLEDAMEVDVDADGDGDTDVEIEVATDDADASDNEVDPDATVPADSGDPEEPTPEEAVEGMDLKRMKGKKTKSAPARGKTLPNAKRKNADFPAEDVVAPEEDLPRHTQELSDDEKEDVREAKGYCKAISEAPDLSDDDRHEAYHHGKMMDRIAVGRQSKAMASPHEDGYKSIDEMDDAHPARKACGAAAKYFKAVTNERAFGDAHRQEAGVHMKAFDEAVPDALGDETGAVVEESGSPVDNAEVAIDDADAETLKSLVASRRKMLDDLKIIRRAIA